MSGSIWLGTTAWKVQREVPHTLAFGENFELEASCIMMINHLVIAMRNSSKEKQWQDIYFGSNTGQNNGGGSLKVKLVWYIYL